LLSKGQGLALIGTVILVGAGIIAAIVLTRNRQAPEQDASHVTVEAPVERVAVPDETEKNRHEHEKRRPEYLRRMIEGGIASNARRYEDAAKAYQEALKLFPDDTLALQGLREIRLALTTKSQVKHEGDKRQAGFAVFLEQGKEAMTAKQYAAAVRAFQQAVQVMPADVPAAKALSEAQTALAADETQKQRLAEYQVHMTAGQAASVAGRYADAVRDYLAALRVMPGDAAALEGQGLAERQLAALQNQEKQKAEYARLLDQAGAALRNQRFQEAADGYIAAQKLVKDDPAATRGLAEAQQGLHNLRAEVARQMALGDGAMRTGRYADAVLAFREAMRLAPTEPLAAKGLQAAEVALNNARTAQVAYLQLMTQGAAALTTQRFADAVQAYTSALQLVPNDPDAVQGLRDARAGLDLVVLNKGEFDRELQRGVADLKQQHFKEAIRRFNRALKLRPEDPQAVQGLRQARYGDAMADGRAAMNARRYADAVRSYEDALREMPGDPAATAALRQARMLANQNARS
jgi:tetratricopeptide (TPR) repeat protein